jgi:bifunctional DNase/RNase
LASRDGGVVVDARPSDSIAIALRFGAVIYAHESLLADAVIEEVDGGAEPDQPSDRALSADELKAYLENMRPEDFGKFHL